MSANLAIRYVIVKRFATDQQSPSVLFEYSGSSEVLQARYMDTNDEVRRKRLAQLCELKGGIKVVAEQAGMNWQALDQIQKKVLLPPRADGKKIPRSLGDDAARRLERAWDLGQGWLDWPFEGVEFSQWAALDPFQRAFAQAHISLAIEQAAKAKMPATMKGKPVSNKKVEQHFPALPAGAAKAAYEKASRRNRTVVRPIPTHEEPTPGEEPK